LPENAFGIDGQFVYVFVVRLVLCEQCAATQNTVNNTCSVRSSPNQQIRNIGTQTVIMAPRNLKEPVSPEPCESDNIPLSI
jgi:hypothetical protein